MLPADAPTRTDLQLAFIGVALVSGFLAAVLSSLPIVVGGPIGSLLASVAVVDGVALNPPTEQ
ncbi:hypothetical protein [Halolamina sp.]|jgi:hypothetical protein|uniref:hypothetical protein n=1 Tax=Halolamina sp. TaxID=1940283 RepID=UPI000223B953|nr:hypothetical protein Halar_1959 [halophilic archaeon DL31]